MRSFGLTLSLITGVIGLFFPLAWILTVGGIVLYVAGRQEQGPGPKPEPEPPKLTPEEIEQNRKINEATKRIALVMLLAVLFAYLYVFWTHQ